jgi:dTDP-4-amino-4,6-dideoxygalactose transaminase
VTTPSRSIPLSRPPVDDEIKRAVLAAIDSRQYASAVREFEAELAAPSASGTAS